MGGAIGFMLAILMVIALAVWLLTSARPSSWPDIGLRRGTDAGTGVAASGASARGEIESAEAYRNHLAMARWIELQLKDDLVRSSVDETEQARARRMLQEFYGEDR